MQTNRYAFFEEEDEVSNSELHSYDTVDQKQFEPHLTKQQKRRLKKQRQLEKSNNSQKERIGPYCPICQQDMKENDLHRMCKECDHSFCKECLDAYVKQRVYSFMDVICPQEGCNEQMDQHGDYYRKIHKKTRSLFYNAKVFKKIGKNSELRVCPATKCSGIVQLIEGQAKQECKKCKCSFCMKCWMGYHEGECDPAVALYLQNNYNFKKCPSCLMIVERNEGCSHMKCYCGEQFCHDCGQRYSQNYHRCPLKYPLMQVNGPFYRPPRIIYNSNRLFVFGLLLLSLFFGLSIWFQYFYLKVIWVAFCILASSRENYKKRVFEAQPVIAGQRRVTNHIFRRGGYICVLVFFGGIILISYLLKKMRQQMVDTCQTHQFLML